MRAYGLVVRFLAYTGLRWGEMAALRVRDVDLVRRRMLIARSVTEDNGRLIFDTTKTGEERTVPLPRFLAEQVAANVAETLQSKNGRPKQASDLR